MITSEKYYTIQLFSKGNSVIPCECSNTQYNIYPYAERIAKKCMRELAEKNIEVDRAEITFHSISIQKQESTYKSTIYWIRDLPF